MRASRRAPRLIVIGFTVERSVRRFWRGMCGITLIRWRNRRWLRPPAWSSASTISRRLRRSIRSGWNGWLAARMFTRQMFGTTNVRTIFSSSWTREGEELIYTVRGSGFLHHMVRNLVGTFLLVGKGTVSLEDLRRILEARERTRLDRQRRPADCIWSRWSTSVARTLLSAIRRDSCEHADGGVRATRAIQEPIMLWRARSVPRTLLRRWPPTSNSPCPASPR